MSSQPKIEASYVWPSAKLLVKLLAPACVKISIAGSLRRLRPIVGDIEIVAIGGPSFETRLNQLLLPKPPPVLFADELPELSDQMRLLSWDTENPCNGQSQKKLRLRSLGILVDLYLPRPDNWGNILTLRTGDEHFTHALVTPRRQGGLMPENMRQRDGRLHVEGVAVPCETEEDLFCYLGLDFIPPALRDAAMAYKLGARTQSILTKLDETLPAAKPAYAMEAA